MQKIWSENMQKYAVLHAIYAQIYIFHTLHLYALPLASPHCADVVTTLLFLDLVACLTRSTLARNADGHMCSIMMVTTQRGFCSGARLPQTIYILCKQPEIWQWPLGRGLNCIEWSGHASWKCQVLLCAIWIQEMCASSQLYCSVASQCVLAQLEESHWFCPTDQLHFHQGCLS